MLLAVLPVVTHGRTEAALEQSLEVVWVAKAAKLGDLPDRVFSALQHVAHVRELLVADRRTHRFFRDFFKTHVEKPSRDFAVVRHGVRIKSEADILSDVGKGVLDEYTRW